MTASCFSISSAKGPSGPLSRKGCSSKSRLAGLTVTDMPAIPPERIAQISKSKICYIPVATMGAMTRSQVQALTADQFHHLTEEQALAIVPHLDRDRIMLQAIRADRIGKHRIHVAMNPSQYPAVYGEFADLELRTGFTAQELLKHWDEIKLALAGIHLNNPQFSEMAFKALLEDASHCFLYIAELMVELYQTEALSAKDAAGILNTESLSLGSLAAIYANLIPALREAVDPHLSPINKGLLRLSSGASAQVKH